MVMAKACDDLAKTLVGKKGLAVEAFAYALRALPTILCENGGYDA